MRRIVALALVVPFVLVGCSSQTDPDPAVASLESRVATVEDRLAGVEAVVGQALIAEPAKQLQADLDQLEKDLANAQVPADVTADFEAAKQAVAEAQAAAEAAIAAEAAEDAAAAEAVDKATAAIADARAKVDAIKKKLEDLLATRSPSASPPSSESPSPSAS